MFLLKNITSTASNGASVVSNHTVLNARVIIPWSSTLLVRNRYKRANPSDAKVEVSKPNNVKNKDLDRSGKSNQISREELKGRRDRKVFSDRKLERDLKHQFEDETSMNDFSGNAKFYDSDKFVGPSRSKQKEKQQQTKNMMFGNKKEARMEEKEKQFKKNFIQSGALNSIAMSQLDSNINSKPKNSKVKYDPYVTEKVTEDTLKGLEDEEYDNGDDLENQEDQLDEYYDYDEYSNDDDGGELAQPNEMYNEEYEEDEDIPRIGKKEVDPRIQNIRDEEDLKDLDERLQTLGEPDQEARLDKLQKKASERTRERNKQDGAPFEDEESVKDQIKNVDKDKQEVALPKGVEWKEVDGENKLYVHGSHIPTHLHHFILDPFGNHTERDSMHERKVQNLKKLHSQAKVPPLRSKQILEKYSRRQIRVAELVKQNLQSVVQEFKAGEPVTKMLIAANLVVTGVTMSKDLKKATVYWNVMKDSMSAEVERELQKHVTERKIRGYLSRKISYMKFIPELVFEKEGKKEDQLLNKMVDKVTKELDNNTNADTTDVADGEADVNVDLKTDSKTDEKTNVDIQNPKEEKTKNKKTKSSFNQ